jgi:tRNA nucleotidyltransferase (CCA-adding enzyme)
MKVVDIITSHMNADFDSLASMVAAKKLYPDAEIVFPGSQEKKLRDFLEVFHPIKIKAYKGYRSLKVTGLIIADTKIPARIGPFAELLSQKNIKIHIYDHHPFNIKAISGRGGEDRESGCERQPFLRDIENQKIAPDTY